MTYNEKTIATISNVENCLILRRENRFVVLVKNKEHVYRALLRNTGKLRGIIEPGKKAVCLRKKEGKTQLNLVGVVDLDDLIAIVDTNLQEKIFQKSVENNILRELQGCSVIGRNPKINDKSRLDFLLECHGEYAYVELKSAVMRGPDQITALYPDTPSDRGIKHMLLLLDLVSKGYRTYLIFIAGLPKVIRFSPNYSVDPRLKDIVPMLRRKGISLLSYRLYGIIINRDLNLHITTRSIDLII